MSAIVSYSYYMGTYMGADADEASFPALSARAEDIVGAMSRWAITADNISDYPALIQTLYKKAICAQTDFFAVNGTTSATGESGRGWTVGKVTVAGKSGSDVVRKGALAETISPMALAYLEQTGLMNPQVPTGPDMPLIGWWW